MENSNKKIDKPHDGGTLQKRKNVRPLIIAAGLTAMAFSGQSFAVAINTFQLDTLVDVLLGNEISQTSDEPCFIGDRSCNNDSPTGYTPITNADITDGVFDLFSPEYAIGAVRDKLGDTFIIGIDINTTGDKSETLGRVEVAIWDPNNVGQDFNNAHTLYTTEGAGVEGTVLGEAEDLRNGTGWSDWGLGLESGIFIGDSAFEDDWIIQINVVQSGTVDGHEQYFAVPWNTVPVPATAWLFVAGVLGLGGIRHGSCRFDREGQIQGISV